MKIDNFVKKIEEVKGKKELDISAWEDLSIGIMNLVSLEEHCFFSYVKTEDKKYLEMLENVRELRKKLLKLIVKDDDGGEKWCMSKHFLASSMRLFETGNRLLHDGKEKEADEMYKDSAELYGMFWKLNIDSDIKKSGKINLENSKEKKSVFASVKKLLECCME